MQQLPLGAKLLARIWADYPPGTDMAQAVAEQLRLGNQVLEVDHQHCRILLALIEQ
jgi:hypothetical protein